MTVDNWIRAYRWLENIHPKTEWQYKTQKAVAGILPGYGNWMESRAHDEQVSNLRNRLGVSWADIKSPWIADLSGHNGVQAGAQMVSRNLSRLYADFPSIPAEKPPKRASFSGRYGGRHRR